ncbi:hypothetical protein QJS10_CPA06g01809 [Acorus calamus]|uniref:Uncharacterized protein n=1 Tax=Acorus calamus TaxID=4465 RepID=A0AAV9EJB4_ACOCL|nr:hypothetical protein QJS10_CPA06g01809 [Acorus calamus]
MLFCFSASSCSAPLVFTTKSPTLKPRRRVSRPLRAVNEEQQRFEIDRDKAREALERLGEQLQSLASEKRRVTPTTMAPKLDRDQMTGFRTQEMPEISGSYVAYTAVALLLLTVFNNIVFSLFIQPSIDGNEPAKTITREPFKGAMMQEDAPPLVDMR